MRDVIPVVEIARAPINFVDDDVVRLAAAETAKHVREFRSAAFRGRQMLFEPGNDRQPLAGGEAHDGVTLFIEGDALGLFFCGYTHVPRDLFHEAGELVCVASGGCSSTVPRVA